MSAALEAAGIRLRNLDPGEHRTRCPKCERPRSKPDTALAVRLDHDGAAIWTCHRCGWRGGARPEERPRVGTAPRRPIRKAEPEPERYVDRPFPWRGREYWNHRFAPPRDMRAIAIWDHAGPIWGTPAELYLRRRGLIPPGIKSDVAPYPWEHLRFLADCPFDGRKTAACLIGVVNHHTGWPVAIQRIALTEDGRKAAIPAPKLSLGPIKGSAFRAGNHRETDELAITEGIEDAIAYQLLTGTPAWAALSAINMQNVELPAHTTRVVIVADRDETGEEKAVAALERFSGQGRKVRIVQARNAKDAAELLEISA